jgi:hypothetical protein
MSVLKRVTTTAFGLVLMNPVFSPAVKADNWNSGVTASAVCLRHSASGLLRLHSGDAWLFQRRASRDLERLLRDRRAASHVAQQPMAAASPKIAPVAAPKGLIAGLRSRACCYPWLSWKGST